MNNILFIHVPKTGGTTLDEIISANFAPSEKSTNNTGFSIQNLEIDKIYNKFKYISGHMPSGMFNIEKFKTRITVLRDPRDIIISLNEFSRRYKIIHPRFTNSITSGEYYDIYKSYFSKAYDLKRHQIDFSYGIFTDIIHYVNSDNSVDTAISKLHMFNWVIDFSRLEETAKTIIYYMGFFPLRKIPHRRYSKYQPDLDFGERFVSNFDREFYSRSRELFVNKMISSVEYENYRKGYAVSNGIRLIPNTGINYSLNGIIGNGWYPIENSIDGNTFRWSQINDVTIEIPIFYQGVYEIYFYSKNSNHGRLIIFQPEYEENFHLIEQKEILNSDLIITKNVIRLISPGWINFSVQIKKIINIDPLLDLRTLGIYLSHIYIFRREY